MGHEELIDFCKKHKTIICYGAGKYAMTIREFLFEQNIALERFVVTNKKKHEHSLMGLPVDCISDILPLDTNIGIIIGVGETKHEEIKRELQNYDIKGYFLVTSSCFKDIDQQTSYTKKWHNNDRKICVLLYHRVCKLPLDVWGLAIDPA